jgi:hypothetical protein
MCSRTGETREITERLLSYYSDAGVTVIRVFGAPSIYFGYQVGVANIRLCRREDGAIRPRRHLPEDVSIFCHDDIDIVANRQIFDETMTRCADPRVGFVGPVGARSLPPTADWGGVEHRAAGDCGGIVFMGGSHTKFTMASFGNFGWALILDGLFMAIEYRKLRNIKLACPPELVDGWHFYDLYYSLQSYQAGFANLIYPLFVMHDTRGTQQTAEWEKARAAFSAYLTKGNKAV